MSAERNAVSGHPLVVISPHPFPIVVGDLADFAPDDPDRGPERVLYLRPQNRVRASVVIGRRCDGAKSHMTRTTITFSSYGRDASLEIPACRREGATIYTGPYLLAP